MRKTLFLVVLSIVIVWSFSSVPSCPTDEAELSSKRVQTLITYGSVVRAAQSAASTIPFNLDYFISQLASVFTPDATFSVPSGVGVYAGLNDVAEYLALQHGQKECHIPHAPQLGSVTQARLAALGSSPVGRGRPTESTQPLPRLLAARATAASTKPPSRLWEFPRSTCSFSPSSSPTRTRPYRLMATYTPRPRPSLPPFSRP